MTSRWLLALVVAASLCACGGIRGPGAAQGPRGTLRICATPAGGNLEIDETRIGPLGMFCEKGVLLSPGTHRVVATAASHLPEYRFVEVKDGEVVTLEIELRVTPP